jgi:hypothetical protein
MTPTEIQPKPTPIGGVGSSVSGLNRNGTETVFGSPPPAHSNQGAAFAITTGSDFSGSIRRRSLAAHAGCKAIRSTWRTEHVW